MLMRSDIAKSDSTPLCVFIAARSHSGSTMLELLLNRYPKIAAVGEVDQLPLQIVRDGVNTKWVGLCSCGKRPIDCDIWGAIIDDISSDLAFDLSDYPFAFPVSDVGLAQEYGWKQPVAYMKYAMHRVVRDACFRFGNQLPSIFPYRSWVRNREVVYRALADKHSVSAIVDASKDAMQMSDLFCYAELPIKVLFLTRDVRGNAWSAIRRKDNSAANEARNWVSVNRLIHSRLMAMPKSSWMHIKYDFFCVESNTELSWNSMRTCLPNSGMGAAAHYCGQPGQIFQFGLGSP